MMQQTKVSKSATRVHLKHPNTVMKAAAIRENEKESLQPGLVSASLKSIKLSSPDDPQEREADNTADRIMRMPALSRFYIQRQEEEEAQTKQVQRQEEGEPVQTHQIWRRARNNNARSSNTSQRPLSEDTGSEIRNAAVSGRPLPHSLRRFMEPRFNADFSDIRIHTDSKADKLNRRLSARAFAYRNHLFFAENQFQPDTNSGKHLIAHELTHTIQQGAAHLNTERPSVPQPRSVTRKTSDVQQPVQRSARPNLNINKNSGDTIQRLGIGDALDYFADRAYHIPGFRMFTILLGVNPINMGKVQRSTTNIFRAIVEFLPGGYLITQALENHGILNRVAGWIASQLNTLSITGNSIRQAVMRFLDSISWRDILNLSGVWQRAKRIFTEPINRIISFIRTLVTGILRFIKDAVLLPLARRAAQTRGWQLLCSVLGRNPITGEPVERNAENLIGGFMRLIGREDVWDNIRRANAIPRAWAWFRGAISGLMGFVRSIPRLFIAALQALKISDLINIPAIFVRVAHTFAGFALLFVRWAGRQVLTLLRIIFEVVAPGVMPYLRRARAAFSSILLNPIRFVRNLVRAAVLGFRQFARNIWTHLRTALINWLTGTLSGTGVYIPQSFSVRELIKFVLSILGITWQNIRRKLVRVAGEKRVAAMERGFELVKNIITEGPAALWQKIRESIANLHQMVIQKIMSFVAVRIVKAAIVRLVSMLNPAGAVIQAIIAIYNTIMFFVERLRTLVQVVASFVRSIVAIAGGRIRRAAVRVEQSMAGALTLVISFLARLMGLGNISGAIRRVINRIQQPINRAIDKVVRWMVKQARRLGHFIARKGVPKDRRQRSQQGLRAARQVVRKLPRNQLGESIIRQALRVIKVRYGFRVLEPRIRNNSWWVYGQMSPEEGMDCNISTSGDTLPDQIDIADNSNVVRIQNYSRNNRSGALASSLFSGSRITLSQAKYMQDGQSKTQDLNNSVSVRYTIAAANSDYSPPSKIPGIVDSSNPEEYETYSDHRKAFEKEKRKWWRDSNNVSGTKIDRLINQGWIMTGNKRGLRGGTTKWRYIYNLFNSQEREAYGKKKVNKNNMEAAFKAHPDRYREEHFYQQWSQRISEQTEIHHLLPLDFGGVNEKFIPLSRDKHTKSNDSIHQAFWNPLKRWLVGLRAA